MDGEQEKNFINYDTESKIEKEDKSFRNRLSKRKKILIFCLIGTIIAVVLLFVVLEFTQRKAPSGESIKLDIDAPSEAVVGNEISFKINYANEENIGMGNLVLNIEYPSGFIFKKSGSPSLIADNKSFNLSDLVPGERESLRIWGLLYGEDSKEKKFSVSLSYMPDNFRSTFEAKSDFSIKITHLNLDLIIDLPEKAQSGDEVLCKINWQNLSSVSLDNVELRVDYPEDFEFIKAEPKSSDRENTIWNIGALEKGSSGEIKISGKVTGEADEEKLISVNLGILDAQRNFYLQAESSDGVRIIKPAVELKLGVNEKEKVNANPGEKLNFKLEYENTGSVGLTNVVITSTLDAEVLDTSTLVAEGGYFNNNVVTWNSTTVPGLAVVNPGEKGSFTFKVKVATYIPISSSSDKNFVVTSKTKAQAKEISKIQESNQVEIKINTKLDLSGYSTFISGNGSETYTIHLTLANGTNDAKDVIMEAVLPTWANFLGNTSSTQGETPTYDSSSRKIVWKIGDLSANLGSFKRAALAKFNLSILKTTKEKILLTDLKVTGIDTFTDVDLEESSGDVKSDNY